MAKTSDKEYVEWEDLNARMQSFVRLYLGKPHDDDKDYVREHCDFPPHKCKHNALKSAEAAGYSSAIGSSQDLMSLGHKVRRYLNQYFSKNLPDDEQLLKTLCEIAADGGAKDGDRIRACTEILEFKGKYIKTEKRQHSFEVDDVEALLGLKDNA